MPRLDSLISPISIAPMVDWTYTHFRVLMRLLAPHVLLYTEMQPLGVVKNNPKRALLYAPIERPLALQLGGSDKNKLIECAKVAEYNGFSEVNLNLGCPSKKVQTGKFGACLMAQGEHIAHCIDAMKRAVSIPITAKTRIGIDHQDSYSFFASFAHKLIDAGCDKLIVHARKAWLNGLNPKQNRSIPPLQYDFVYRIKEELPTIPVVINGSIETIDDVRNHMRFVNGIMIGRLAYKNPYALTSIHQHLYPDVPIRTRSDILRDYIDYLLVQYDCGVPLSLLLKPIFNIFHGLPHAKAWKKQLLLINQYKQVKQLEELIVLVS